MDEAMTRDLVEYGRTIQLNGWAPGEILIRRGEQRFKDFRKWVNALAIVLRTTELLKEDGRVAK